AEATLAHFDGFLPKPLGVAEIEAAIAAHGGRDVAATVRVGTVPSRSRPKPRISPIEDRGAVLESLAASVDVPASNKVMDGVRSSPTQTGSSLPGAQVILDEIIYGQLASAMPAKQLHEMYAMCLNDARARIANMRSLAAEHDDAQFMREAHAIKGSGGMLGATEMHRIAAVLEKRGPDAAGSAVNSLDELAHACDQLERMLSARA